MPENLVKSNVAKREEETLKSWEERDIFKKSLEKAAPKGDYVFYDGPPFATGLPHYGHLSVSAIKDAVARFWTMRGYRVPRKWGWDCHGLPIETLVEKKLGFKHKKDILEMGVAKFNERCREQVLTYASEWEKIIPRIGRWADMQNAYRTMDKPFMESVWWVFKQLYDKGLVYEDYRSMHLCPRCETTLSQQEVSEGYKYVKDIAVTVKFKAKNPEKIGLSGDVYLLAWTTTPWTLPGNVALAVGERIEYGIWSMEGTTYLAAAARAGSLGFAAADRSLKGSELVGLEYEPPFDYYKNDKNLKNRENGWKVYAADFVTADEGTGIAHEAPAFGADDWELLKKVNLPFVQHVNPDGTIKPEVKELAGRYAKPADDPIATDVEVIKYLAHKGLLFAKEKIEHAYPHCWRCDTPLLNYATSSWFVKVEEQKDRILKSARPISWSPAHIKGGRWGKWLEGARDWSISRQRFWASVIPLWRCEQCKMERVFGSASELEEVSGLSGQGKKVDDLHKHIVDEIAVPCECGGKMRRIPDVLDTWFDSGSMPYGQAHYPFENKAHFEATFPAYFITEALDQTRAWFYYLHVIATSLFDTHAFKNVIVSGIVLAEDGKKMSKKLKNYPDPMHIVNTYGADAMRFVFLSSPVVSAENLSFSERAVDEVLKKNIQRLTNVLAFYQLYTDSAQSSKLKAQSSNHVLDRWLLARLDGLVRGVTAGFEKYQLDAATRPIGDFIDDLSTWYLRRSRERFKDGGEDARAALATLRYTLHALARVMAPAMPFFAEHLFQAVREGADEESVHLTQWPAVTRAGFFTRLFGKKDTVLRDMAETRAIVSSALEQRAAANIKVRQPLARLTVRSALSEEYFALIRDEVNVKEVVVGDSLMLNTNITSELRDEGIVRDCVRLVQDARKQAQLKPGEHGSISIVVSPEHRAVVEQNLAVLQKQTNTDITFSLQPEARN